MARPPRRYLPQSLRATLLALALAVPVPILLAQGVLSYFELREARGKELEHNLEVARAVARAFEAYVDDVLRQEHSIGLAFTTLESSSAERKTRLLQSTARSYPAVRGMSWLTPDGRVSVSSDPRAVGMDFSRQDFFRRILAGQDRVVSDLLKSGITGRPTVVLCRAIRGPEGNLLGVVNAVLTPEALGPLLDVRRAQGGRVLLRDRRGLPVASSFENAWSWEQREQAAKLPMVAEAAAGREVSGLRRPVLDDGGALLAAAAPVGFTGWSAWAGRPLEMAMAAQRRWRLVNSGLLLLVGLVAFGGAVSISRFIAGPVTRLRDHALAVGRGELDRAVQAEGPAEVSLLAQTLNQMTAELRQREEERDQLLQAESEARSQAEDAQRKVAGILESITDAFLSVDLAGRITYFNREAERVLRTSRAEMVGCNVWTLYPGGFGTRIHRLCLRALSEGRTASFKAFYAPLQSWFDVRAYPSSEGLSLYLRDITEREKSEKALEKSESQLRQAQALGRMGNWEFDLQTHELAWSDEVYRLYGRDPVLGPPSVGEHMTYYYDPEDAQRLLAAIERSAKTGESAEGDYRVRLPSRAPAFHWVWISPIRDPDGRTVRLAGVVQDVTERKRLEEALREAKEKADAANRAKSEFLANMSHEVRTPMNAVIGLTELVLKTELTPDQQRYLRVVKDSADSLLRVIDDILDFSKVEAGRLDFEEVEFDVRAVVESAVETLAAKAHAKGLELCCRVTSKVPATVFGDSARVQQVLRNLIGNAVKFTEKGEVDVRVTVLEGQDVKPGSCVLHVSVRDTGIGISPDQVERLFQRFSQADGSLTRKHGGTGLGLAISRKLAERMGGSIWAESVPGEGTTFFFTAVCTVGKAVEGHRDEIPRQNGPIRALLIDESQTSRSILADMLGELGIEADATGDADEGLSRLTAASDDGDHYGIVFVDSRMPGSGGFAVAERIRQDPGIGTPVIMMITAQDIPGEAARCRRIGMCGHLVKPIKEGDLRRLLGAALRGHLPMIDRPAGEASGPQERSLQLKVLLAEDDETNQMLVTALLAEHGWAVVVVGSGQEALDTLSQDRFDAVLMDVQMPGMDGLEATRILRDREARAGRERGSQATAHVPVIGLTAHALKGDRERCLAAGMDEYLSKPVQADALYQAVARCTGGRAALWPPAAEPCDLTNVLHNLHGSRQLLERLTTTFLSNLPDKLERLRAAVQAADLAAIEQAAHAVRGGLAIFHAEAGRDLAAAIESRARASSLDGTGALLRSLEDELGRLTAFLSREVFSEGGDATTGTKPGAE